MAGSSDRKGYVLDITDILAPLTRANMASIGGEAAVIEQSLQGQNLLGITNGRMQLFFPEDADQMAQLEIGATHPSSGAFAAGGMPRLAPGFYAAGAALATLYGQPLLQPKEYGFDDVILASKQRGGEALLHKLLCMHAVINPAPGKQVPWVA